MGRSILSNVKSRWFFMGGGRGGIQTDTVGDVIVGQVQIIRDEFCGGGVRVVAKKYTKKNDAYRCRSAVEKEETGSTV
jgi:hypothetical protein